MLEFYGSSFTAKIVLQYWSQVSLKCHICSKSFGKYKSLTEHITYSHEKPYKCSNCPKAFGRLTWLTTHTAGKQVYVLFLSAAEGQRPYELLELLSAAKGQRPYELLELLLLSAAKAKNSRNYLSCFCSYYYCSCYCCSCYCCSCSWIFHLIDQHVLSTLTTALPLIFYFFLQCTTTTTSHSSAPNVPRRSPARTTLPNTSKAFTSK